MAITKKKNGKYQVRVYVGYDKITGKRKTKYATCETMREARLKEAQLITDVETGELVPEWDKPKVQKHYTFDEAFEEWFDIYKRQGRTNATVSKVEYYFRHYLMSDDLFGGMYLERMTRKDIQKRINEFMPRYVRSREIIGYAKRMLKWAVDNEDIAFDDNPLEHVQMVQSKIPTKRITKYYNEEQIKIFEIGINEYWGDTQYDLVAIFETLIRTGARIGEVLALKWKDVDFGDKCIVYRGRISRVVNQRPEYLDGLKNGDGQRIIQADDVIINVLRRWRSIQREYLFSFGIRVTDDSFLFTSMSRNQVNHDHFRDEATLTNALRRFNEWYNETHQIKLPYLNIHGFRHTHASLLISNGVELKQVADRLGHKDITVTANIYADVTPKARREVADKFSEIMGDNA
ncbi:tyrosine-type recombinase/integrase [Weissella viridescens]|uniref:tyrosine-type recombinase/integrase n=1 Tax=Weissella viridescens TaxID=1629 RepID=UPI003AF2C031